MGTKKILYITQEITPYLPDSPIATTCRYLPQAIQEKGQEIRTFMPKFGNINESHKSSFPADEFIGDFDFGARHG